MVRYIALFALVLGASGLQTMQQIESFEQALEQLNHNLAAFENRDLKDSKIFEEYVGVRNEAKKAAQVLAEARKEVEPPAPTDWGHDDIDEEESEPIAKESDEAEETSSDSDEEKLDEKTEKALLVDMDFEDMSPKRVEALALKVKEEQQVLDEKEDDKEKRKQEKYDLKVQKELKLKLKKEMRLKDSKKANEAQKRDLLQFQSPYRNAMKKAEKEATVIDEGRGTYGKFKDLILGEDLAHDATGASSFIESEEQHPQFANFFQKQTKATPPARNLVQKPGKIAQQGKKPVQQLGKTAQQLGKTAPKKEEPRKILSLEATMAQREKELQEEAMIRKKATVEANKALKLCNGVTKCEKMVEQKLEHGVFDHQIKDKLKGYRF